MSRGSDQTWTGKRTFRGGLEDPGAPLRNVRDGHRTDRRQCAVRGAGPRQTVKLVLAEQDIALDLRPERRVLDLGAGQLACVLRERHGRDREHGGRLDRVEVPLARERLAGRERGCTLSTPCPSLRTSRVPIVMLGMHARMAMDHVWSANAIVKVMSMPVKSSVRSTGEGGVQPERHWPRRSTVDPSETGA